MVAPSVGDAITLEWNAPPSCASVDDVRAAIDRSLARESFGDALQGVVVQGSIVARQGADGEAQGWALTVRTTLPSGVVQREVSGEDCRRLGDAAGLIIAVDLDPLRVLAAAEVRPPPPPTSALAPQPVPEPEPEPEPEREREPEPEASSPSSRPGPGVELRGAGLGEIGSLPVFRVGAWLSVGLWWPRFELALAGQYWGPRRIFAFAAQPSAGVMVQQGGVALRGCVVPGGSVVRSSTRWPIRWSIRWSTCAGIEAGVARGRGVGLTDSVLSQPPWVAVTAGQRVTWVPGGRIGVWGGVDAMLHVVRPQWRVQGLGMAARTRPAGIRVVVGPIVRL